MVKRGVFLPHRIADRLETAGNPAGFGQTLDGIAEPTAGHDIGVHPVLDDLLARERVGIVGEWPRREHGEALIERTQLGLFLLVVLAGKPAGVIFIERRQALVFFQELHHVGRRCTADLFPQPAHELRMFLAELLKPILVNDVPVAAAIRLPEPARITLHRVDAAHLIKRQQHVGAVGEHDLVLAVKPDVVAHFRVVTILPFALGQQVESARDVEILVGFAVAIDGDVIRQVPALEEPRRDEVRLEPGRPARVQVQLAPLVLFHLLARRVPEHGHRYAAETGEGQHDCLAGQLHVATIRFIERQLCRLGADSVGAVEDQNEEDRQDHADVDDLALERLLMVRVGHGKTLGDARMNRKAHGLPSVGILKSADNPS